MFDSEVPALIYSLSEFTGDSREGSLLSSFTIFFVIREFLVSVISQRTSVLIQDLLCVCVCVSSSDTKILPLPSSGSQCSSRTNRVQNNRVRRAQQRGLSLSPCLV